MKLLLKLVVALTALVCAEALLRPIHSNRKREGDKFVPVYVMMNLDWVTYDGKIVNWNKVVSNLTYMKQDGNVDGINVDVWWGIVEKQPGVYNWDPYLQLIDLCEDLGLHAQMIMSFHQCGGNVNDDCYIPIPDWVRAVGNSNPDIFYTDMHGHRDEEYLSLGVDQERLFGGRSPVEMYRDYMEAFVDAFDRQIGPVITEVQVGLGPAGELRYPSYQTAYWSFPGVGEFICYDKYMLNMLAVAANKTGHPEWGYAGPNSAGSYNSFPDETCFFNPNCAFDNFASPYGQFFLTWYSEALINHGDLILREAKQIFGNYQMDVAAKVSGVHWQYFTPSHAAELTAGYKNDKGEGYLPIAQMFKRNNVMFDFTCLEMKDSEQPSICKCGPVELVGKTQQAAVDAGIKYSGENALVRYDNAAYEQIEYESDRIVKPIDAFTYLRLSDQLLSGVNWDTFKRFVYNMHHLL